ncbi:MAG: hypothetical protein AB8U25_07620 [Rickettsiales endosymbiont of Dermacentor nuttalli]
MYTSLSSAVILFSFPLAANFIALILLILPSTVCTLAYSIIIKLYVPQPAYKSIISVQVLLCLATNSCNNFSLCVVACKKLPVGTSTSVLPNLICGVLLIIIGSVEYLFCHEILDISYLYANCTNCSCIVKFDKFVDLINKSNPLSSSVITNSYFPKLNSFNKSFKPSITLKISLCNIRHSLISIIL